MSLEKIMVADDDVNITGSLENSVASNLSVSGADLVVTGTVKNDEADGGTLTLNVDSWRINGGNQNTYSLVNNGNLYATVDGETYMEYGLNLTGMGTDNEFSLTTGTLVFGASADSDKWFGAFANNLNKFNVNITGGDLDNLTTVLNGANGNTNATMTVAAQNIVADSVQNAYDITMKRRKLQMKYNEVHGITPKSTQRTLKEKLAEEDEKYKVRGADIEKMPKDELRILIRDLEKDMRDAAARLDFERAADLRNKLYALKGFDK